MDDGTQANGDSMLSSNNCDFYDVYANSFSGSPPLVPRNSGPTSFTGPIIASLPSFPSFSCNPANDVTVAPSDSLTLPPGVYGNLRLNDDATLTLQAGTYTFCDFSAGLTTHVINTDSTIVQDAGDWVTNNGIYWGPSCLAPIYVQNDKVRFAAYRRNPRAVLGPQRRNQSGRHERPVRQVLGRPNQQRCRRQRRHDGMHPACAVTDDHHDCGRRNDHDDCGGRNDHDDCCGRDHHDDCGGRNDHDDCGRRNDDNNGRGNDNDHCRADHDDDCGTDNHDDCRADDHDNRGVGNNHDNRDVGNDHHDRGIGNDDDNGALVEHDDDRALVASDHHDDTGGEGDLRAVDHHDFAQHARQPGRR